MSPRRRGFTGQRLDDTGLYYYGARYYDCTIERLILSEVEGSISADTVVQSPFNPQTLNRYSYCLNNPLKYIDPSGHKVEFEYGALIEYWFTAGIEPDPVIFQQWLNTVNAFSTVADIDPELAQVMIDADETILIREVSDLPQNRGGQTHYDEVGNICIDINKFIPKNVGEFATLLAHESFHALAGVVTGSISESQWEETFAFKTEDNVGRALGVDVHQWHNNIAEINWNVNGYTTIYSPSVIDVMRFWDFTRFFFPPETIMGWINATPPWQRSVYRLFPTGDYSVVCSLYLNYCR